jgi:tetratricopeptide (TPR) repeat protein
MGLNQQDKALLELENYIKEYPKAGKVEQARNICSWMYSNKHDYNNALRHLKILAQKNNRYYQQIARIYKSQGKTAEVESLEKQYKFKLQENPAEYTSLAQDYEKQGKYEKAIKEYEKIIEKYYKQTVPPDILVRLAKLHAKTGNVTKSEKMYDTILSGKYSDEWKNIVKCEAWLKTQKGDCPKKLIHAVKTAEPPVIDGSLNDSCWTKTKVIDDYVPTKVNDALSAVLQPKKKKADYKTTSQVVYDNKNLYINFYCTEPEMNRIKELQKNRDVNVWLDDCIEIFLDTQRDYLSYYQFEVNPIATSLDLVNRGPGCDFNWNSESKVKTSRGKDFWVVEIAIPFKDMIDTAPKKGDVWGINLRRFRWDKKSNELNLELSYLSKTLTTDHEPARFGYLVFE